MLSLLSFYLPQRKSRQLSNNCAQILVTLNEHNLEGSALQEVADEVEVYVVYRNRKPMRPIEYHALNSYFLRIKRRVTEYSRYPLVKAYSPFYITSFYGNSYQNF